MHSIREILTYKVIQTDLQYNAQYSGNSNKLKGVEEG